MFEPALPVEDVPYDRSVENTGDVSNMDAAQYLSWVRSQANRLPTVFRADSSVISKIECSQQRHVTADEIVSCPSSLRPSIEWEREVAYAFSELRSRMEVVGSETAVEREVSVPAMKDRSAWLAFCLGDEAGSEGDDDNGKPSVNEDMDVETYKEEVARRLLGNEDNHDVENNEEDRDENQDEDSIEIDLEGVEVNYPAWTGGRGLPPTTRLLLQLDQVLTQKVFMYLAEHLSRTLCLSLQLSLWLYSLLSRVEKPLHREVVAVLREVYRTCCAMRGRIGQEMERKEGEVGQGTKEERERELARLNTIIVVTGLYFGQGEAYRGIVWEEERKEAKDSEQGGSVEKEEEEDSEEGEDVEEGEEMSSEEGELEDGEERE